MAYVDNGTSSKPCLVPTFLLAKPFLGGPQGMTPRKGPMVQRLQSLVGRSVPIREEEEYHPIPVDKVDTSEAGVIGRPLPLDS